MIKWFNPRGGLRSQPGNYKRNGRIYICYQEWSSFTAGR